MQLNNFSVFQPCLIDMCVGLATVPVTGLRFNKNGFCYCMLLFYILNQNLVIYGV